MKQLLLKLAEGNKTIQVVPVIGETYEGKAVAVSDGVLTISLLEPAKGVLMYFALEHIVVVRAL